MLFCLGMPAHAAASHRHEFSPPPEQRKPLTSFQLSTSPQSPDVTMNSTNLGIVSQASAESLGDISSTVLESRSEYESSSKTASSTASGLHQKRAKRAASKQKTSFQLAHPPPVVKHKQRLKIRPRLLLQLQQISDSTRAVPTLDVLPSITFAPRLAKRFPRIFKGKDGLGADDLVIVQSESYDTSDSVNSKLKRCSEEDDWNNRDFVAAICQVSAGEGATLGNAEICLNHGSCWEASSFRSGAYEFVSVDEEGQRIVARWVRKSSGGGRRSEKPSDSSTPSMSEEGQFNFSIINPGSRRHPVIATLNRQSILVSNRYSVLSSPTLSQPSASSRSSLESPDGYCDETEAPTSTTVETDEHLRTMILVTGIWVAFREGYSPNFRYDVPVLLSKAAANAPSPSPKSRSLSINLGHLGVGCKDTLYGPKVKKGVLVKPGFSQVSSAPAVLATPSPKQVRAPHLRAHSTGSAFLRRANDRHSSSAVKTSLPRPVGLPSSVASCEESDTTSNGSEVQEVRLVGCNGTDPAKPGRWQTTTAANRVSSFRSSLATIEDIQVSSDFSPPAGGDKPGRMDKLFGFIRKTSGAH